MIKKLISIGAVILVLALLLTLAPACGNGDEEPTPGATPTPGVTPTPGATPTPTPEPKTLKVGFFSILSGPAAPWGSGHRAGVEWAADDINDAGGIKVGNDIYMVDVTACDTAGSGSQANTCLTELIYDRGIKYLIGPLFTDDAIMPILEQNEVFCCTLNASGLEPRENPDRPYYINGCVHYPTWVATFYAQCAEHNPEVKKVAILAAEGPAGELGMENSKLAAEAAGLEYVTETYAAGSVDFYPALTKILTKNPDAMEVGGGPGDQVLQMKQARELGYEGQFWHVNWVPIGLMVDTMGLSQMYGIKTTLPDFTSDFYSEEMQELNRRYMEERAGADETDMPDTTVHGYSHMMFYAKAIETAGSIEPTEVLKVIDDPNFRFERYYVSDASLSGLQTTGINRQMSHFNPYGEVVIEGDEAYVVQMDGRVVELP